jgi:hypothetical protein
LWRPGYCGVSDRENYPGSYHRGIKLLSHLAELNKLRDVWLFTKGHTAVKGEGRTDNEALDQVRIEIIAFGGGYT